MSGSEVVLLVLAGIGAGLAGSIAGLASLVSYPALLAAGLSPVAANVTNTVALVGNGIGSALGSRPELRGQGRRLLHLGTLGVVGGAAGGGLLLLTPPGAFERVVPWLIGLASAVILVNRPTPRPPAPPPDHAPEPPLDPLPAQPLDPLPAQPLDPPPAQPPAGRSRGRPAGRSAWERRAVPVGIVLVAAYGGYFGAAAGVLFLALLLAATGDTLPRSNAAKNVVLAVANAVAAVIFIALGPVDWTAVVPLGAGCLAGARMGPAVVRRAPARGLRILIGTAGLALATKLAVDAYT
jgi:uncharacterized membrane protein YfcA